MNFVRLLKQTFDEEINLKLRTLNLIHWTAIFGQFFQSSSHIFILK